MSIDQIIAYLGFLGAIILGVIQNMYTSIPKYIGWPIIITLLIVSAYFILPPLISIEWTIGVITILAIIMIASFVYYWRNRKNPDSRVRIFHSFHRNPTNKYKAFAIQQRIDKLYSTLWKTKDDLPADTDLLHNKKIIQIMDELQSELNKLGQIIKDREYDRWTTHFVSLLSRMLRFHLDIRKNHGEMAHAMINAKLRDFINRKVRG